MVSLIDSIKIIAPIFLLMLCGVGCRAFKLIDDNYLLSSNRLLFYFFLPAFLFIKIAKSHLENIININLIIGCYLGILITFLMSYFFVSTRNLTTEIKGSFIQGSFRGNTGYIGLAVVMSAYGEHALFTASVLLGFLTPLINFLAILSFLLPKKNIMNHKNLIKLTKDVVLNPIILSSLFGMSFNIFDIHIPKIIDTSLSYLSNITLPLALFIIGGSLKKPSFNKNLIIPIWCNFFKLILMPIITYTVLFLLNVRSTDLYIGLIFAAAPTAVVTYVFASQFNGDTELASLTVITSVIFSFFTYPLLFWLFRFTNV
ncbi:AEC family transporter [Desulfothermus okinawensis JCM 13304]